MNTYRVHVPAVKDSSLTATTVLGLVPCDRDAVLEKVLIASRTGITHHGVNYSQIAIKNGTTLLASRVFNAASLAAKTNEELSIVANGSVDETTCLNVEYDFAAAGLAIDLDVTLVFRLSRP